MSKPAETATDVLKSKIEGLLEYKERRRHLNLDVFSNPEKHLMCLAMDKIVADAKVFPEAVEKYKVKIRKGQKLPPIIVVKHPKFDVYAVLDGHHRYYAYAELGWKELECALAGDFSSVFFYMTDRGFFQPNPDAKELKAPEIKFHNNLQKFLENFLKDPDFNKKKDF